MGFSKSYILLLVIATLAGVAYWDENKTRDERVMRVRSSRILNSKSLSELEYIEIKAMGDVPVRLVKSEADWYIQEPVVASADQSKVAIFIDNLRNLSRDETIGIRDTSFFGFKKPSLKIVMKFLGNESLEELKFGMKSPVSLQRYLQLGSTNVVSLVREQTYLSLSKGLSQLRSRKLSIPARDLVKWSITSAERSIKFFKREKWYIEGDYNVSLDQNAVNEHINVLSGNIIKSFIDQPSQQIQMALDPIQPGTRRLATLVWSTEREVGSIKILLNNEKVYAQISGEERYYVLDSIVESEVLKDVDDFFDTDVVGFDSDKVESVKVNDTLFILDESHSSIKNKSMLSFLVSLEFLKAPIVHKRFDGDRHLSNRIEIRLNDGKLIKLNFFNTGSSNDNRIFIENLDRSLIFEADKEVSELLEAAINQKAKS